MGEPPQGHARGLSPWIRLAVTACAPLVAWLVTLLPMPVDVRPLADDVTEWFRRNDRGLFDAPVLGLFVSSLVAYASTSLVVEAAAAIVPAWRKLRHGGAGGRRALARASVALYLVAALAQGFGIARLLQSMESSASVVIVMASAGGGAAVLLWIASALGRFGLVHGVLAMIVGGALAAQATALRRAMTGRLPLSGVELGVLALGAVVVVLATARTTRPAASTLAPGVSGYREESGRAALPISVTAPTCGIVAAVGSGVAGSHADTLATALGNSALLAFVDSQAGALVIRVGLALVAAVALTWAVTRSRTVAAISARAAGAAPTDAVDSARAAVAKALRLTVAFVALLVLVDEVVARYAGVSLDVAAVALATTIALDAAAELRARRALGPLAAAWPEVRPYALEPARFALERAGIACHVRDARSRALLHVFAPYAPSELLVRPGDVEAARAALEVVLPVDAPEVHAPAGKKAAEPSPSREPGVIAVAAAIALGVAAWAATGAGTTPHATRDRPLATRPVEVARHVKLEFVDVDDDANPFGGLTPIHAEARPPHGARVEAESVPAGVGKTNLRQYLAFVQQPNETRAAALARAREAIRAYELPKGDHFAFGDFLDYDEAQDKSTPVGVRTYVLSGPAVLTNADVEDAIALPNDERAGAHVALTFTSAGGARFQAFTRAHLMRRFAIVVDGEVISAPRILSEIAGGHVTITMGNIDPDQQFEEARELAAGLRAGSAGR